MTDKSRFKKGMTKKDRARKDKANAGKFKKQERKKSGRVQFVKNPGKPVEQEKHLSKVVELTTEHFDSGGSDRVFRNGKKRAEMEEPAAESADIGEPESRTPTLDVLLGSDYEASSFEALVDKIIAAIKERLAGGHVTILRGRTKSSHRITFDPKSTNVTSIAGRLHALHTSEIDHLAVERLVRYLAIWNRDAFPELDHSTLPKPNTHIEKLYRSQWLYHQKARNSVERITYRNRKEVVEALFESVRKRCELVDPQSTLLRHVGSLVGYVDPDDREKKRLIKRLQKWSLFKVSEGFGAFLMCCFDGDENKSVEYEDLLECALFRFRMANREAVYGPKTEVLEQ